jgi:uncharacterized protein (DUF1330 family)
MSENKTFLVINAIINKENMADVQTYIESIMPVMGKNGGQPTGSYKTMEQLAGEASPEMISIIEFPSADAIREMVAGEEFVALAELRARAFSKLNLMICGES